MLLLDLRSIIDSNGLLSFRTYLNLILAEIIEGKNENSVHDLVLERLIGYFSTYRNSGDLDFRSGEIFTEIKKLPKAKRIQLAKHFQALLACDVQEPSDLDWNSYIKNVTVKNE